MERCWEEDKYWKPEPPAMVSLGTMTVVLQDYMIDEICLVQAIDFQPVVSNPWDPHG